VFNGKTVFKGNWRSPHPGKERKNINKSSNIINDQFQTNIVHELTEDNLKLLNEQSTIQH
jgi:hypothetical protein